MPFTSESARKLGSLGGKARKTKDEAWLKIVGWLAGEGGRRYNELLAKQSKGTKLSEPEREFMDRYYDLLEFHQPKLARNDGNQKIDQSVTFKWDA